MIQPTLDILERCAECSISRLTKPSPWYAYPDYIPPPDTFCLLVHIRHSKFRFEVAIYKDFSKDKKGFFNTIFLDEHPQIHPDAWQPIELPATFIQKPKKK